MITPSPKKKQQWSQGVKQASTLYVRQARDLLAEVENLLTTSNEIPAAREAMAFVLREKIQTICAYQNYDLDDTEQSSEVLSKDPKHTNEDGDLSSVVGGGEHSLETEEPEEAEAADPEEDGDEEYLGEEAATYPSRPTQFDDILSLNLATITPGNTSDAWTDELARLNVIQGDGSMHRPIYVGGKHLSAAPSLIPLEMDITSTVSKERMREIQVRLSKLLTLFSWKGYHNRKASFLKLHPWAVICWVNIFTGGLLGTLGIQKIMKVMVAVKRHNENGDSSLDAQRAFTLSIDPNLNDTERSFYGTMATTLSGEVTIKNAYAKFCKQVQSTAIAVQFENMVTDLQRRMTAPARNSQHKHGPRGHSASDIIAQTCSEKMRWKVERFRRFMGRYQALSILVTSFSAGFLLLAPDNLETEIKGNSKAAVPEIVAHVESVFPELLTICSEVHTLVEQRLLTENTDGEATMRQRTDPELGDASMMDRLKALLDKDRV